MTSPSNEYVIPVTGMYAIPINSSPIHQQPSTFLVEQTFPKLPQQHTADGSKRNGIPNMPMFMPMPTTHFDVMTTAMNPSPMPIQGVNQLTSIATSTAHTLSISHQPTHLMNVGSEPNASLLLVSQHPTHQKSDLETYREIEKLPVDKEQMISELQSHDLVVKTESHEQNNELLKKIVSEVNNPSVIWKSVREKILSQCRVWDLLLDKASLSHLNDTKARKMPKDNLKMFQFVVTEIETLLGEFKCFMDGCLDPDPENVSEFYLGPEISRAFDLQSKSWKMKENENINQFYAPFFNNLDPFSNSELSFFDNFELSDNDQSLNEEGGESDCKSNDFKDMFTCSTCDKIYTREQNFEKHKHKCSGGSIIEPTKHCKWHERSVDGQIVCDFQGCGNSDFLTKSELWLHFQDEHALPEDFIYTCNDCQETTVHPDLLKLHYEKCHPESNRPILLKLEDHLPPEYACEICQKSFSNASSLHRHERNHVKKEELSVVVGGDILKYSCDLCDFSTSAMNGLSLHKRRLHKLDKSGFPVTQIDNPDYHNRDPKKFKHECRRCTRRYKKIHHLERHLIKCDGIPPPTLKPMWEKTGNGRFSCSVPGT